MRACRKVASPRAGTRRATTLRARTARSQSVNLFFFSEKYLRVNAALWEARFPAMFFDNTIGSTLRPNSDSRYNSKAKLLASCRQLVKKSDLGSPSEADSKSKSEPESTAGTAEKRLKTEPAPQAGDRNQEDEFQYRLIIRDKVGLCLLQASFLGWADVVEALIDVGGSHNIDHEVDFVTSVGAAKGFSTLLNICLSQHMSTTMSTTMRRPSVA